MSLTIYRDPEPKAEVQLSQRQKAFLDTAQSGGIYKTPDYAEITGVVVRQAQRELSELVEIGFLQDDALPHERHLERHLQGEVEGFPDFVHSVP